jgi:hypothetical protein
MGIMAILALSAFRSGGFLVFRDSIVIYRLYLPVGIVARSLGDFPPPPTLKIGRFSDRQVCRDAPALMGKLRYDTSLHLAAPNRIVGTGFLLRDDFQSFSVDLE